MIYSGPKFEAPVIDYLSWVLARRGYKDDDQVYIDAANPTNAITYRDLVYLTKHMGRGLRELEGIGAHGEGKDIVIIYATNQVLKLCLKTHLRLCIPFQFCRLFARVEFILPLLQTSRRMKLYTNSSY
jgi:hypothetical protein